MNNLLKIDFDNRIFGLDLLRAFAIFFVMYRHGNDLILPYANKEFLKVFELDGVTIFFVLSGFLIGRILIKIYFKNTNLQWCDLGNFWARRWLRTLPPYFLVLTVLVAAQLFILGKSFEMMYLKFYGFVQNLWYPHPLFFGEAYSLSVEEWFYVSFPGLLFVSALVFGQLSKRTFLGIVACFFLLSFGYRTYVTIDIINSGLTLADVFKYDIQKVVFCRFDSLMFGVLAAYIYHFYKEVWESKKEICFLLGLLLLYIYKKFPWLEFPFLHGVCSLSLISLAVVFLLPKLNNIKSGKGLFAKFITIVSVASYAMYLINLTLRQVLIDYFPTNCAFGAYIKWFLFWSSSILVSIIFYRIIEYPVLKLRDKWYKKQSI